MGKKHTTRSDKINKKAYPTEKLKPPKLELEKQERREKVEVLFWLKKGYRQSCSIRVKLRIFPQ